MDKKKIGFYAIIIGMILLIFALIFTTLHRKNNNVTDNRTLTKFEEDVEKHADYVQDQDKDPFNEINSDTGDIKLDKLNFEFKFVKGATYENTAPTLIDSSNNFLLFSNLGNVLTFYNMETRSKKVVDKSINQALITPDEQFIVYTKNAIYQEDFYYVDLATHQVEKFYTYKNSNRIRVIDMQYKEGMIYFLVQEPETGKTYIQFTAIPAYADKSTRMERDSIVNVKADNLFYFDKEVYTFNKETNAVEQVIPNNPTTPLINITSEKVKDFISVDFITREKWVVTVKNDKDEVVIITPKGKITEFKNAMGAYWFDKNHLIVNDRSTLYLYNLDTKEKSVVKSDITAIFPTTKTLTMQLNNGDILTLKKK